MQTPMILLMLALLVTAALSGCVDEDDGEGTGTMTFYVKDAPTDEFSEIWLRFSEVLVHRANGNDTEDSEDNETADAENGTADGWITVLQTARAVNLLNFSEEGSKAFLGNGTLEAGRYTQIRIDVTEAWGIRASDGENVTITVSSGTAKVVRSFEIDANATTQVVIDLDLDRSLVQQGGPSGQGRDAWRLTPVIGSVSATTVEEDEEEDVPDA